MAAGMVPPLGMALATTVRSKLFTKTERENGKAAWVLGASFITEGAIPFAAADPLRVIPSIMAAGATGALSMAFGAPCAPRTAASSWSADRQPVPLPAGHRGRHRRHRGLVIVLKTVGRKDSEEAADAPATSREPVAATA